jgi:hypothetical protein
VADESRTSDGAADARPPRFPWALAFVGTLMIVGGSFLDTHRLLLGLGTIVLGLLWIRMSAQLAGNENYLRRRANGRLRYDRALRRFNLSQRWRSMTDAELIEANVRNLRRQFRYWSVPLGVIVVVMGCAILVQAL